MLWLQQQKGSESMCSGLLQWNRAGAKPCPCFSFQFNHVPAFPFNSQLFLGFRYAFTMDVIVRWLGHNCSHMHDIARAHLLAAGADFDAAMHSMFRRQVRAIVLYETFVRHAQSLLLWPGVTYIHLHRFPRTT